MTCLLRLGESGATIEPIWGELTESQFAGTTRGLLADCNLTMIDWAVSGRLVVEGVPLTWKKKFLGAIVNFGRIIEGPGTVHILIHRLGLRPANSVHSLLLIRQTLAHSDIDGRIVVPAGRMLAGEYVCKAEFGGLTESFFLGAKEGGDVGQELGVLLEGKFDARCWFLCENRE